MFISVQFATLGFFQLELTHVVAAGHGGSVRLRLSCKDGVAAIAGCVNEPIFRECTVATLKHNN